VLLELSIQRIALIESLQLHLKRGFNVFTGETGAGKSILLDALGLLLGNRASADLIRYGCDSGYVEALFDVNDVTANHVIPWLSSWGIELDDGRQIIVSRELHRSGRNVCRVNGRMVTVQQLKELGGLLVQQHGQHDHQGLLKSEEQLQALDLYAEHADLLLQVQTLYQTWSETRKALRSSVVEDQERARRLDMLNYQIDEIEQARLTIGEEDGLREMRRRLQHADKILSALSSAVHVLQGADGHQGVLDMLGLAANEVSSALAYQPELEEAATLIEMSHVHADEAIRALHKSLDDVESDPERLQAVESRFAEVRHVERKYGPTVEAVLSYLDSAKAERDRLLHHEEQIAQLEVALREAESALEQASSQLHRKRSEAAKQMSLEVESVLKKLSMPNVSFQIVVQRRSVEGQPSSYTEKGDDTVQYWFSANKGEAPKTFQKIASGGELSRTLLGMKTVLAAVDELESLIFDEIDTGVSGIAAQAIADLMKQLAVHRQVLCVTHSAQIAASANAHFFIRKDEGTQSTQTVVETLDHAGKIREIARLLGSDVSDDTAVQHATALLQHVEAPLS
jgi:DNA repair protein RecN (Recombination protein N)